MVSTYKYFFVIKQNFSICNLYIRIKFTYI